MSVQGSVSFPVEAYESVSLLNQPLKSNLNTSLISFQTGALCMRFMLSAYINRIPIQTCHIFTCCSIQILQTEKDTCPLSTSAFKLFRKMLRRLGTNVTSLFPFEKEYNSCICSKCTWKGTAYTPVCYTCDICISHPDLSGSCSNG